MKKIIINKSQSGISIMELMVGIAIGMIIMVGLITTYVNSTRAQREMAISAEQIENGRLAIETLSQSIRLAGYYEKAYIFDEPPSDILTDPCSIGTATGNEFERLSKSLAVHVYALPADSVTAKPDAADWGGSGNKCGGFLDASNLMPGSDLLVVRRASTAPLIDASVTAGASGNVPTVAGEVYLQTGPFVGKIFKGTGANITNAEGGGAGTRADGGDAAPDFLYLNSERKLVPGPVSKYIQHVYFVSPCSRGTGSNGACVGGDDSIPTLKRLELTFAAGGTTGYSLNSLVEGVQAVSFDFGIDNLPAEVSEVTGQWGDGEPDSWGEPADLAQWRNVVAVRVNVLARNTASITGALDSKTYDLGSGKVFGPFNDNIKRRWYGQTVRVENISKRRERP